MSERYITARCLPDKAIDVIDEAGARVRLRTMSKPPDLKDIDEDIEKLNKEKEDAVANQDFEKAAACATRLTSCARRKRPSLVNGAKRVARQTASSTKK